MTDLTKLREVGDYLADYGKFDESYIVYDEVYSQIWSALGIGREGIQDFSQSYFPNNISSALEFKNQFSVRSMASLFMKWFNSGVDETLFEFIHSGYGRMQSVCYSDYIINETPTSLALNEFLVLYSLVLHSGDRWITEIFTIISPQMFHNRVDRYRTFLPEAKIEMMLIESAENIKGSNWNSINLLLLDYLTTVGLVESTLFRSLRKIVGPQTSQYRFRNFRFRTQSKTYEQKFTQTKPREFDPLTASDDEKTRHYGKLLGLEGKLTKAQIRKRYLHLVMQYHPDRVSGLGDELRDLADRKTKMFNEAYEWFRRVYKI